MNDLKFHLKTARLLAELHKDDGWHFVSLALCEFVAALDNRAAEPVAYRAWFDQDNGARWLFTLWPEEERLEVDWQPLYATAPCVVQSVPMCVRVK